jgi:hypothetical protein
MVERSRHRRTDLSALWAEYKELTSRHLPERAGSFVRSRRFDRLLPVYVAYSCVVLGIIVACLVGGTDLPKHLPGWRTRTGP